MQVIDAELRLFALIESLGRLRTKVKSITLDTLFSRFRLGDRSWKLLDRSILPGFDVARDIEQLNETIVDLFDRLSRRRDRPSCLTDDPTLIEEANIAVRLYSTAFETQSVVLKHFKPLIAELETYLDERGRLAPIPLKQIFPMIRNIVRQLSGRRRASMFSFPASGSHPPSQAASSSDQSSISRSDTPQTLPLPRESPVASPSPPPSLEIKTPSLDTGVPTSGGNVLFTPAPTAQNPHLPEITSRTLVDHGASAVLELAAREAEGVAKRGIPEVLRSLSESKIEESEEEMEAEMKTFRFRHQLRMRAHHIYPPRTDTQKDNIPTLDRVAKYLTSVHSEAFVRATLLIDLYLLAMMAQVSALSAAELLKKTDDYGNMLGHCGELAGHVIRAGLPLLERLLVIEPNFITENIMHLSMKDVEFCRPYSMARQLLRKCRALHTWFTAVDIHVFPSAVQAHEGGLKAVAVANMDSTYAITGGYDCAIRIWDTQAQQCLGQFQGHRSIVTWVGLDQLDNWLASTSFDGSARIWDSRTGDCKMILEGHSDAVLSGDIGGPQDELLLTASMDCTVRVWNTSTGRCARVYKGHRNAVKVARFLPGATGFVSAGLDRQVLMWNLGGAESGPIAPTVIEMEHKDYVLDLLVCRRLSMIVTTGRDKTIRVWDLNESKLIHVIESPNQVDAISLALSDDEKLIAAAYLDNTIGVIDTATFTIRRLLKVHNDGALVVKFVGHHAVLVGSQNGSLQFVRV